MSEWDWAFTAEIAVGVFFGLSVGGYVVANMIRMVLLEALAHPTTRALARAADKLVGKGGADSPIGGLLKWLGIGG